VVALTAWTADTPSWDDQGGGIGGQPSARLCRGDARRPVADAGLLVPTLQRPLGDLLRWGAARDPGVEPVRSLAGVPDLRRRRVAPVRTVHRARPGGAGLGPRHAPLQHEVERRSRHPGLASGFVVRVATGSPTRAPRSR
jgi:hypothetical protein